MLPRIIARMDIKGPDLIKPINLEGVRKVGTPRLFVADYYEQGVDEIIYNDVVASLYGRNNLSELVKDTMKNIFVPLTVVGGIRSIEDVDKMLNSGADKIGINTAAVSNPEIIDQVAQIFGSQCMVASIEAKMNPKGGGWEVYTNCGRDKTGLDVIDWVREVVDRGAGEVFLTSIDHEGMCDGFDLKLCQQVSKAVTVPVILSGGMGKVSHMIDAFQEGKADAIAIAHVLHYHKVKIDDLRSELSLHGYVVRRD